MLVKLPRFVETCLDGLEAISLSCVKKIREYWSIYKWKLHLNCFMLKNKLFQSSTHTNTLTKEAQHAHVNINRGR